MPQTATPNVGDGATLQVGSDRYPYTVIAVLTPKKIVLQEDNAIRTDDRGYYTESQQYRFERNERGETIVATLRSNGKWVSKGGRLTDPGFYLGERSAYRDPSF
jgi:hypothetical protein